MKPPAKPFIVEVRRSRSNVPAVEPARPQRPVVIEAPAPVVMPSHSEARLAAERAFKALAAGTRSDKREEVVTAESVFRSNTKPPVPVEPVQVVSSIAEQQTSVPDEIGSLKPRKPRTRKPAAGKTPAAKSPEMNMSTMFANEAASILAQAREPREQQLRTSAKKAQGEPAGEKRNELPPALELSHRNHQAAEANQDWAPGQRWKRRLRHLR